MPNTWDKRCYAYKCIRRRTEISVVCGASGRRTSRPCSIAWALLRLWSASMIVRGVRSPQISSMHLARKSGSSKPSVHRVPCLRPVIARIHGYLYCWSGSRSEVSLLLYCIRYDFYAVTYWTIQSWYVDSADASSNAFFSCFREFLYRGCVRSW